MDRRFFQTGQYLAPIGSNWKLPSVRATSPPPEKLRAPAIARLARNRGQPETGALRNAARVRAPLRVRLSVDEKKFFIKTGEFYVKKDGSQGAEKLTPIRLVTVTASIMRRQREVFNFSVTNRATRVLDSRDGKRKPISEVRSELQRMALPTDAADTLQAFIAEK